MIVGVASAKGAPGVTSCALVLAHMWPRPVIVLEADTAGGDLVFRVRTRDGELLDDARSVVQLAAASRQPAPPPDLLGEWAQPVSETVSVVKGVTGSAQARSLAALWSHIGKTVEASHCDVIVDLGRIRPDSAVLNLAQVCDELLLVTAATLEGVTHVAALAHDLSPIVGVSQPVSLRALVVSPDAHASNDRRDIDSFLSQKNLIVGETLSLPYDPNGLALIEAGQVSSKRAARSLLVRAGRRVVETLTAPTVEKVAVQ